MSQHVTEVPTFTANGITLPVLGQGTWRMGENTAQMEQEITALQTALNNGMTLFDTAEMYGDGRSELLLGKALKDSPRQDSLLVSKVYPHNAGKDRIFESCDQSLARLGTDHLDLYLLHWRGGVPLSETVNCMEELVKQGKIKRWGVSNFDTADMQELWDLPMGQNCAVNQVLYHLGSRGIEYDLLPWHQEHDVGIMAYCPLAQAGRLRRELVTHPLLLELAEQYECSVFQILLAFVLRQKNVTAIPKAATPAHVLDNLRTVTLSLSPEDWEKIDNAFPSPTYKMPLDIE